MKVVFTDYQYEHIDKEVAILSATGAEIVDLQKGNSGRSLDDSLADTDAVVVQYAEMTRERIAGMSRCKMIIKYGIGVNNIDVDAASEKGIYVCNVPDYGIDEVSNHAIAMMLSLHRKLNVFHKSLVDGVWGNDRVIPIHRLAGSTVGLVGLGRIPSLVADKLRGFGVRLIAYDPYVRQETADTHGVTLVDFDTLCAQSDMISVHCPLTQDTQHLFDREAFGKMTRHAILVNTSRGPVDNEVDLIHALTEGQIAAAGLDTFETEPLPSDSPLLQMENAIVSPHCAWYSEEAIAFLQEKVAREVANVLSGNPPYNCVNTNQLQPSGC